MLLISFVCLGLSSLVNFHFSIQILRCVSTAQIKVNFIEIRWQVHKHLKNYCRLTRQSQGRIGSAFYGYWLSLLVMLVSLGFIFASLARLG